MVGTKVQTLIVIANSGDCSQMSRMTHLFFFCLPGNIFIVEPKVFTGIIALAIFSFTVFLLNSQKNLGPDFYLPKFLKNEKFDYLRKLDQDLSVDTEGEGLVEVVELLGSSMLEKKCVYCNLSLNDIKYDLF